MSCPYGDFFWTFQTRRDDAGVLFHSLFRGREDVTILQNNLASIEETAIIDTIDDCTGDSVVGGSFLRYVPFWFEIVE